MGWLRWYRSSAKSCGACEARLRGSCPCDPMDGLDGLHKIANSAQPHPQPRTRYATLLGTRQAAALFWEKLIRLLSGILVLESQTNSLFFHG